MPYLRMRPALCVQVRLRVLMVSERALQLQEMDERSWKAREGKGREGKGRGGESVVNGP